MSRARTGGKPAVPRVHQQPHGSRAPDGAPVSWLGRLFAGRPKASAQQARQLQDEGAILLDVREDAEWRAGHAPGARHIPLSRLPHRLRDVPARRTIITVCRSGSRSARAAALLAREGHEVINLAGGMHAWARAGLPVVASGGGPGRVA